MTHAEAASFSNHVTCQLEGSPMPWRFDSPST